MAQYTVKTNQNIFDVAIELYGSVEGLFDLMISNDWLSMTTELKPGMELEYHDYFIINEGIVKGIKENNYIPANGERNVYFKPSSYELFSIVVVDSLKIKSSFTASGQGTIQIDWGDNSELQTITLTSTPKKYEHFFNNNVDERRLKLYGDCSFMVLDTSEIDGVIFVTRPIIVDEYINKSNTYPLKGLFLFEGTVLVDLQGMFISDLLPIADMSLQELNLLDVKFSSVSVIDDYLQYIVANYGDRRNCTVHLDTKPSESGMNAIETIINEPSWNEGGKWKFIINDIVYTGV